MLNQSMSADSAALLRQLYEAGSVMMSMEVLLMLFTMAAYALLCRCRQEWQQKKQRSRCSASVSVDAATLQKASNNFDCTKHDDSHKAVVEQEESSETAADVKDASFTVVSEESRRPSDVTSTPACLATVIEQSANQPHYCANEVTVTGSISDVKAVCRAFRKHGFLKTCDSGTFPLNGHWETDHGMTVAIDGKIVRWSHKRASKLKFLSASKNKCTLSVYGEPAVGQLVTPVVPGATKALRWDNGDVWHSFEGCRIAHSTIFHQRMTKVTRDGTQDNELRGAAAARLQLVSKSCLNLPANCLDNIMECIGSGEHLVKINFDSRSGPPWRGPPEEDILASISHHHPQVRFQHCWAQKSLDVFGQRTVVRGEDIDETATTQ